MGKSVKLIVENRSSIPDYVSQLDSVFGDAISVLAYSMDDSAAYEPWREAVILTSAFSAEDFPQVKKTRLQGKRLVSINLSLQRKSLLRLNGYPKGTQALLVNVTKFMAEETIAQLCQAGYGHISFIPWYPGCKDTVRVPLAVTPGEGCCAPEFVTELIDLGPRQIDIATMIELAVELQCAYILRTRRFFEYFEKQFNTSAGVSLLVEQNQLLEERLSALVQMFDGGLLGIAENGAVFDCNFRAAAQLGKSRAELLKTRAGAFLTEELLEQCRSRQVTVSKALLNGTGAPCAAELTPITRGARYLGAFAALRPAGEESGAEACNLASRKGHAAKYRFSDICGGSPTLLRTVELAKKMARTDSSILITGESGTGKELFAHAIHNNSKRAKAPFVAINCAALPDNLLESELFGYEEGAFTGARKGGKAGLFELADSGSIFLDEIEGMAPSTQMKLLRVIQEREIMRVGGDQVISIDVRIISASNQDLMPLMETGKFRRDLFYRVSTLPLDLPPLRQRKEDVFFLIEEFKSELCLTFVLTEEAKACLLRYNWPGNIRELRNCVEYLGCQNLPVIEPEDLPYTIRGFFMGDQDSAADAKLLETELLRILAFGAKGRGQLCQGLAQQGYKVTEGRLRRELERLKARGWIESGQGRCGSRLTETGRQELKNRPE